MSTEIVLTAEDVSRRFGRRWAVRRVTRAFVKGSVTAVVGDNGAGKSTFLQILAGVLRPTEGRVIAFGEALSGLPTQDVRARLAVLMHQPGVYLDLSGRENLSFFAQLHDTRASDGVIAAHLDKVGLAEASDRPARTYSRGMMQRLALARVLLQAHAELWLLDEPTTGLDARGVELLAAVIAGAKADGKTVIAVTHDLPALGPAVDDVVRFQNGRLV